MTIRWFVQTRVHQTTKGFLNMLVSSNIKSLGRSADIHTITVTFELINVN